MSYSINDLLNELKQKIEQKTVCENHLKSTSNFNGFEKLVSEVLTESFQHVEYHENYGHHFPDIDVIVDGIKYGIELKSRTDGSWTNNGGSVFESVSSDDYNEIFVLFGTINRSKQEQHFKVRFAPYWEVAENIKVTHKPRYYLNMNAKNSIFDSSQDYMSVRNMTEDEKNSYVQDKLRKSANKPQWYIAEIEKINPTLIKNLDLETKNRIISEIMVLFPQDLLKTITNEKGKSDYTRATEYLISTYYYYSPATRDLFTAGGQFNYHGVKFPKIIEIFRNNIEIIIGILENQSDDFFNVAYKSWNELNIKFSRTDVISDYKIVLDTLGEMYFSCSLQKLNVSKLSHIIFELE